MPIASVTKVMTALVVLQDHPLSPGEEGPAIVMTAADAEHTSFGCAPERDWTYFGDAFFHHSLHPGSDFESAFNQARILIHGWETMDHATPSQ